MKIKWNCEIIIIVMMEAFILPFSVLATIEGEREDFHGEKCSFNFISYDVNTHQGPTSLCANISLEKVTWDEAKLRCSLVFAELTPRIYLNSSLLPDIINKGIDVLWVGIRRRSNFFVTEYPSKLFREAEELLSEYWGYHWSEDQPGFNDCVALSTSSGSLHTRDCADRLPFVCEDDGKATTFKDFACPEDWKLSVELSISDRTCVSLNKALAFHDAKETCDSNGGRLASVEEYQILHTTEPLPDRRYWAEHRKIGVCEIAKNNNGYFNETVSKICTKRFPFVCVKGTERIKVRLSPSFIEPASTDSDIVEDIITCDYTMEFAELNLGRNVLYQWYKDDIPIPLNSYVLRLRFISDALNRDPYMWNNAARQGYYHCEVRLPDSIKLYSSPKLKFFYSDIATYVVEIRGINPTNSLDFSHQGFTSYMDDFDDTTMSSVLEKVKARYPEVEWDFMSISADNDTASMKILVYIYRTGTDDFDDRTACEELKEAFEEQQSVPVFVGNFSISLKCQDFANTNGYVKVMKGLKSLKSKLDFIEETQATILVKLENLEKSRSINPLLTGRSFEADIAFLSKAIEDLKHLKNDLLGMASENSYEDKILDERERNEFEDRLPFSPSERLYLASENKFGYFRPRGQDPISKPLGIVTEHRRGYYYVPQKDLEEPLPNPEAQRIHLERDI